MSYDVANLTSRVQSKLDNTSFDSTKILQFLNDGQRDIIIQSKLPQAQAEGSYTTIASSASLTTSLTNVLVPLNFRIYTPVNYAGILPYIEYQDLDQLLPNASIVGTGPPTGWYMFGGTPFVYPNADSTAYTLKLRYLIIPPALVNTTDVPTIPETYSELLVLAAYKRCLEHEDSFDQAQVIQNDIDIKIGQMNTLAKPQLGTPHVMRQPGRRRILGRL